MCKILNSSLINLIKFPSNNLKIFSSKDRENKWEKNWKWLKISINNFTTRSSIYNYLLDMTCIAKTSMRVVQMTIPLKINCERNLLRIMLLSYMLKLYIYIFYLIILNNWSRIILIFKIRRNFQTLASFKRAEE